MFTLLTAIAQTSKNAQIRGTEIVLTSGLSVGAASRSMTSDAAFIQETKHIVMNMMKSFHQRMEIQLMYGQSGLGIVESVTGLIVKIEDAEWASGIWAGMEGARVSVFDTTLATLRVDTTITKVSTATREVTLAAVTGIVATDVLFFTSAYDGSQFNECVGLHKILSNSGVLFNINAAQYDLWKANVVDVGTSAAAPAPLSFAKAEEAQSVRMDKGGAGDALLIVSQVAWTQLMTEQAAKRSYDSSFDEKVVKNGSQGIVFHGLNGKMEIVASQHCKRGYAYLIPVQEFHRIGSTDITFDRPGIGGKYIEASESKNGYIMRAYCDQALFTDKIGQCTLLRYIEPVALV